MKEIEEKYQEITYKIIGCAMEVHNTLGCGFLEYVYHEALEYELKKAGINYEHEKELRIPYKDIILERRYRVDFVIENEVAVEIKAEKKLSEADEAILINYLNAGKLDIGLLINFAESKVKYQRYVNRRYLS